MLLTEKVIQKWNGKTKQYYIDKGYIFTKMGDEFEVKVEDLTKGSNVLIEVKCDCEDCKNPYLKPIKYSDYVKCVRDDGKYYCIKCVHGLQKSKDKRIKGTMENGKSFEQWCIETNNLEVLNRWDFEINQCIPNKVSFTTHNKYWLKCPYGRHESELKNIRDFSLGKQKTLPCKKCSSFAQWGIDNLGEDFLEKYWSNNNTVNPWEISYGSNQEIFIKCQEKDYHDYYKTTPKIFHNGIRCPYCNTFASHGKLHILDSLGTLLEENNLLHIWSDKNKKSPYEYTMKSSQKVWWKCIDNNHEDYERVICNAQYYEFRCPECVNERNESLIQEKVRLYLESLNYTILHEEKCTILPNNPKTKRTNNNLPFDNEIKELKLIIEVNGIQHEELCKLHELQAKHKNTTPQEEFEYQQWKDEYKKQYALSQGYNYLAISYKDIENNENYKTLINNKIKQILTETQQRKEAM